MRKTIALLLVFLIPLVAGYLMIFTDSPEPTELEILKEKRLVSRQPGTDHSKFVQLQGEFQRPQDITLACISCHNKRHEEVMETTHWRWLVEEYMEGKGIISLGKRNAINNHCISISGSEGACNRCHIGYGWDSKDFDFSKAENIDCIACHDNTASYEKQPNGAGYPKPGLDLTKIAQSVGRPKNENCGPCHFDGGGGNNSKHGDLETALYSTNRNVDVHIGKDGGNMVCVDCHTAVNHKMKGRLYTVASMDRNRLFCEDCHSAKPHSDDVINEHTSKVACQTCHIPFFAKANKTKMQWDWSKAGDLKDGKPYKTFDDEGNYTYLSEKGSFIWEKMVKPDYMWFNGTAKHHLIEDSIQSVPLVLNPLGGNFEDMKSKIYPVKIMKTKQPYDPVMNRIVNPKLWDKEKGNKAYWLDFNWAESIDSGMKYLDLPWSGKYDFVETEMNWLLNHMVSPKEQSLKCIDCHTRTESRLAGITDIYLPGRDYNSFVDTIGIILIYLSIIGVIVNLSLRLFYCKIKRKVFGGGCE